MCNVSETVLPIYINGQCPIIKTCSDVTLNLSSKDSTLEYPAKLIVNGQVIADGFPDLHRYMQTDRYEMLKPNNAQATAPTSTEHDLENRQNTNSQFREANVEEQ